MREQSTLQTLLPVRPDTDRPQTSGIGQLRTRTIFLRMPKYPRPPISGVVPYSNTSFISAKFLILVRNNRGFTILAHRVLSSIATLKHSQSVSRHKIATSYKFNGFKVSLSVTVYLKPR